MYLGKKFPSPYGVSFILILNVRLYNENGILSFRLLTEYHSFLYKYETLIYGYDAIEGFRLLTEYHSFL